MEDYGRSIRREARRTFSRLGLAYFLFLAAAFLFQLAIAFIAVKTGTDGMLESYNRRIALSMISMYGVGFPLFWQVVKNMATGYGNHAEAWEEKEGSFCKEEIEKERWGFLPLFLTFLIAIGVMEAGNLIGNTLMEILSAKLGEESVNDVFTLVMQCSMPLMILFSVILAPVMEELMFRKILIDRIIHFGEARAVIVSGVLFGIGHGNFYQFFYACGLGLIFAYVYVRTGRLRITVAMHMIINGMSAIIAGGILRNLDYVKLMEFSGAGDMAGVVAVISQRWLAYLLLILYTLGLLAAAFVGLILLLYVLVKKKIHFLPAAVAIPGRFTYAVTFLNLGMILFLGICVVQFFFL